MQLFRYWLSGYMGKTDCINMQITRSEKKQNRNSTIKMEISDDKSHTYPERSLSGKIIIFFYCLVIASVSFAAINF